EYSQIWDELRKLRSSARTRPRRGRADFVSCRMPADRKPRRLPHPSNRILLGAAIVLALAGLVSACTRSEPEPPPPNIIIILSDDHARRTISAYDDEIIQ